MKKSKILNIALTTVMLLSTVLTPQMSHALADMQTEDAERTSEVEETDVDVIKEESTDDTNDNSGDGDSAEVVEMDSENEPIEPKDEKPVESDDAVENGEPTDDNNNSPPVEENEREEENNSEADVDNESAEIETFNAELQTDLGNIFTNPRLTLNGEEIQDGNIIDIDENTTIQLAYEWHTEGLDVYAKDTASIQLPDIFRQVNIQNQPVIAGGLNVGTYNIVGGQLTITFNENIEDGAVSNGVVGLNLNFDTEKFEENIEQRIAFNDRDETTLNVIARPTGSISGITKEGHTDRDMNAREITWTIDVMNDNDAPIIDAVLQDILPEGLLNPRDFVINELSVGINGDKQVGNTVDINAEVDGNEFIIDFPEIAPFNGYRVQYITTIEDYSITEFTNNAKFSYGDTELPADTTVFAGNRSNPIEKRGYYNEKTGQIDWTINVNKSGGVIDEAVVYDNLPEELKLVDGSIEVSKFNSDWNLIENIEIDETDFPINLGKIEANEIYQIKFSTDIDWSEVNNGEYQNHNQFTNQTELRDGDIKIGEDETTVDHWRATLLEKTGASNVDYANKTLTWTVEVNKAKHPLNNVVVNDIIPEGLSISEDDVVITGEDGEPYQANDVSVDGQNVRIDLGNIGTETITIKYTTAIEDFTINEFDNKATIDGDGIGEEDHDDNEIIEPPANSFFKDFKGINYNEKTIDWSLTVNPIREAITELTIVDTFPNKGMILLPDTLVVKVGGVEVEEGFTLRPNEEDGVRGYHKGFTIVFDNELLPLNAQMEITYQTSYDPQREVEGNTLDLHANVEEENPVRVYKNHAQFTGETENGNEFDTGREDEETVREDSWNSGKKEGQLVHEDADGKLADGWTSGNERKIAWQLYINYQKQNLGSDIVIEDTLDYEGTIDEGSVIVSVYEVAANGDTTITDEVLSEENYTVQYNGQSFTLTFAEDFVVSERYVVQFTTTVPKVSQPTYTNNATVKVGDSEFPYSGTVNYDKYDHYLAKGAVGLNGNQVYTGDEIEWQVTVNESLSIVQNAVITDTVSDGLVYVEDSLSIETVGGTKLVESEDYTLNVSETDGGETALTITLDRDLAGTLVLNYTTVVTAIDGQVNNTVELDGENIETETITSDRLSARQFSWIGGDFNPNRGAIRLTKVDAEEVVTIENNEATFSLWYELNGEKIQYTQVDNDGNVIPFTTENGILEIGNLPIRTYYLTEIEPPEGYVLSEEVIELTVEPFGSNENYYELEFENIKEKIDVTGTKVWINGPQPSIELQLFRDGEAFGDSVVLETGETEYTWTDLDRTDINGNAYDYTVDEVEVPENYEKTILDDGVTITNEFVSPLINIPVEKEWEDANNQDGIRPESIEVKLLADGEETDADNLTLNAENNWKGTFTDLPELNEAGEVIIYTIEEVDVPEGYGSNVDGDMSEGFNITNSYTPEITEVSGTKEWDDANNQDGIRPESITVNLLANGAEVDEQVVTADEEGNWSYEFTGLPKYEAGEEITYTVTEDTVEDYTPAVDGHDIINSYTPEERSVTVTKTWDDANNQDGKRPESIEVQLYANGDEYGESVVLSDENDWTHTWTKLAVHEPVGNEIEYTVKELNAHEDYDVDINDENLGNVIITNSYTPEVTDVSGEKIWEDADNQDGVRPDEITVSLLANGEEIDSQDVTADDNWSYTFTDLPVYQPGEVGQEIEYTVVEAEIPEGYEVDYDGNNIINSYDPELVEVSITKEWNDEDNLAGFRPDQIEVELIADGEATGKVIAIVADEDGNWEGSFINLPKYRDEGIQIDYTVQEVSLDEDLYSVEVIPSDEDLYDFTLINTHEVERINLNGAKTWDDADNQDGVRPDSITVRLLANGKEVESIAVTDETDWKFKFTNLPKYQNGEEINYTIQEDDVEGYSTEIEGMNIVNSYTPGQTSINVVKAWDDVQNQDGIRPESITVKLLADGKDTGQKLVLTAENNWQGDFIELDLYSNGELIKYTIEEIAVDGYEEVITGTSEDGFVITNTHRPEDPEEPGKETPDDPKGSEESDDDSDLPKTGEAASYTLLALILVGLGFGLHYYSKRRTN